MSTQPLTVAVLALTLLNSPACAQTVKPAPKFFAYCVEAGLPGITARPLVEQAKLLHELGYDGMGVEIPPPDRLEPTLKLLDEAGLPVFMVWTTINVDPAKGPAYPATLPETIRRLSGRSVVVSVMLTGLKPADPQGFAPALKALRALGDAASDPVRISIYNHVDNWTESLPFIVEVVQKVNHPRVGFNFNLCHWLKVDSARDWRSLLREHKGKLFCVTINGATVGAKTWTNGLIRPLDEGDFDNRALLTFLQEIGYPGPVGLMCYGVPGEPRDYLSRSMKLWRSWHRQPAPGGSPTIR